jgi:hypothetical protein
MIDDVLVYNRALNDSELAALSASRPPETVPAQTASWGWLKGGYR